MTKGYKDTVAGTIPADWECRTVVGLAARKPNSIVGGPFGSDLVSNDYVPDGVPVIRGQNMSQGSVSGEFVFVSHEKAKYLQANTAKPGDIVFTQRGTLGQVCLVPNGSYRLYVVSQIQMKLTPDLGSYEPEYLMQYFSSAPGQRQILKSAIQTGVPHTNLGILKSYKLPVPVRKKEQQAIADALSDADALIASLDALIAKKRDLKQAAMQQLLTGKTRLPGFKGEWEVKRLGAVIAVDPDNLGVETPYDYEFKYISLEGVSFGKLIAFSEQRYCSAPSRARRKIQTYDILISTVRPNLKSHVLFSSVAKDWICSTGFSVLRCEAGVMHPGYVISLFFADGVSRQIDALLTGSNYPAINSSDVRDLLIPIPSFKEQSAVAAALMDMDSELNALQAKRDKAQAVKQGMMQQLLTGRIRLV